ncbi:MAG TPA: 6-phosphofructokinase [Stellaceae bacterium]|nr:6-phosphofructokinase [Stellaceae bacterium]
MTKRIGLLTSGGDCGGLNAVIRAVAVRGVSHGWVLGIRNGSMGLLRQPPDAEKPRSGGLDAAMMRDRRGYRRRRRCRADPGGSLPRVEVVAAHIDRLRRGGRNFALVVVAESVRDPAGDYVHCQHAGGQKSYGGVGATLAEAIAHLTGAETRVTVLGHLQRGGQPTAGDRFVASAFDVYAVDLVAAGRFDRMVAWQNRLVVDVPLAVAIAMPHCVDLDGALVRTARGLGICLGDG